MSEASQSVWRNILRSFSAVLFYGGALVFLVGDSFLREFEHADFVNSEGIGILGGVILMALGAAIGAAAKPRKNREQSNQDHL